MIHLWYGCWEIEEDLVVNALSFWLFLSLDTHLNSFTQQEQSYTHMHTQGSLNPIELSIFHRMPLSALSRARESVHTSALRSVFGSAGTLPRCILPYFVVHRPGRRIAVYKGAFKGLADFKRLLSTLYTQFAVLALNRWRHLTLWEIQMYHVVCINICHRTLNISPQQDLTPDARRQNKAKLTRLLQ